MTAFFQPIQDIILVKIPAPAERIGSIIIPEQHRERNCEGEVVGVGPGRRVGKRRVFTPTELQLGEKVVFAYGRGIVMWHEGQEYRAIREPDIIGVISEYSGNTFDPNSEWIRDLTEVTA